jgi:hypothetical protein
VAAAVGISILGGGAADAQEAAETVPTALAPANSVNSASIIAGQVYQSDINPAVVNVLRTPGKDSVTGWTVKDGTIIETDLSTAVKDKLALHAKDGVDGKDGAQGIQGEKGKDGINAVNNLLYVTDGAKHVRSLTYKLDTPVSVKDFQATFFQERVYGNGSTGANVILGVDANDDGTYEGNDLKWQMDGSNPADLNGDRVLQMDGISPNNTKVDTSAVNQWYVSKADGSGWDTTHSSLATVADSAGIADKKVYVVRFLVGGSSAWSDEAIRVNPLLNDQATLVNFG